MADGGHGRRDLARGCNPVAQRAERTLPLARGDGARGGQLINSNLSSQTPCPGKP